MVVGLNKTVTRADNKAHRSARDSKLGKVMVQAVFRGLVEEDEEVELTISVPHVIHVILIDGAVCREKRLLRDCRV